jgi:hypothetical protein
MGHHHYTTDRAKQNTGNMKQQGICPSHRNSQTNEIQLYFDFTVHLLLIINKSPTNCTSLFKEHYKASLKLIINKPKHM